MSGRTYMVVDLDDDSHERIEAEGGGRITRTDNGRAFDIFPGGTRRGDVWRHRVEPVDLVH